MSTFAELGVIEPIATALAEAGITEAFPIQQLCIPQAIEGRDLIGQAKTGTGKTLGFGVPLLQRIPVIAADGPDTVRAPKALVVVPTRELCLQVTADLTLAGRRLGAKVLALYGGRAYEPQIEALRAGVDVVVGTPGRLIDMARQRHLDLHHVRVLVIDEADEMLDMGFLPDVERIVAQLPSSRQTMLFSATMPGQIIALGRRYMNQPTHIRAVDPTDDSALVDSIEQHVWRVHPLNKVEILARMMQAEGHGPSMIFCRTKRRAQAVADELAERGFAAGAIHGDLGQGAREQALRAFRNGKVDVLVATDVAARGIDVEGVTHVVNYECPDDEKTYLHRVGRTGRAGASGVAVTFVDWEDLPRWSLINKALGLPFHDPLETYHTSEHLYTGLRIPPGTPGKLPRAARTHAGLDAEEVEDIEGVSGARRRSHDKRTGHSHHHGQTLPHGRAPRAGAGEGAQASGEVAAEKPARRRKPRPRRRTRAGRDVASGDTQGHAPGGPAPTGDGPAPGPA